MILLSKWRLLKMGRLRAETTTQIPIQPRPPGHGVPSLAYVKQCEDCWCWAACVEMILKHYFPNPDKQCEIARKGLMLKYPKRQFPCCPPHGRTNRCYDAECDQTIDDVVIEK